MKSRFGQVLAMCMLAWAGTPARADVWKCAVDGRTQYSEQPCESSAKGGVLPRRALAPNLVAPLTPSASASHSGHPSPAREALGGNTPAPADPLLSVCPSDRDIASMETTATSSTLPAAARRFVQDEIRRAWQCRKGQGWYTAADWRISREAVRAQSSLSGAEEARIRSESMHSAANPSEGDRIARRRAAEERAMQREQRNDRVRAPDSP